jgi:hypothetical protein
VTDACTTIVNASAAAPGAVEDVYQPVRVGQVIWPYTR